MVNNVDINVDSIAIKQVKDAPQPVPGEYRSVSKVYSGEDPAKPRSNDPQSYFIEKEKRKRG